MKYLFIDTSTHDLTIAIASASQVLSETTSTKMNEHSKYALVAMQETFDKAGLKPNDIDKLLVVNGPGSFTGIRIGVTIAKTYAWTLKKDIIPISSLHAYALGYEGYDYYVSVLDARRDFVYASICDREYHRILEEQYISISKLSDTINSLKGKVIVIGDIDVGNYPCQPIKINVTRIVDYYKDGQPVNAHALNPHYLKLVEAEEKLLEVKE
jgi:tRNA threonylcarbamoyladenosine biosynthesis protein TsaB